MKTFYVIIGPDSDSDDKQFWDVNQFDWTPEWEEATRYDGQVFFMPYPPGAVGIEEFDEDHRPIGWTGIEDPPPYGVSPFAL